MTYDPASCLSKVIEILRLLLISTYHVANMFLIWIISIEKNSFFKPIILNSFKFNFASASCKNMIKFRKEKNSIKEKYNSIITPLWMCQNLIGLYQEMNKNKTEL